MPTLAYKYEIHIKVGCKTEKNVYWSGLEKYMFLL